MIMTGTLCPRDGIPGCSFTVEEISPSECLVTITSPYFPAEVVAQDTMPHGAVGMFLINHRDY